MSEAEAQQAQLIERHNAVWRWIRIFEILGLDRAEALYPELGLDPAHASAWRLVARRFLEQCYGWTDRTGSRDGWTTEQGEAWIRDALAQATEIVGVTAAQALYAWGMGTFVEDEEEPDYSFMWSVLLWNVVDPQSSRVVPPALPPEKHSVLEASIKELLVPSEYELVAADEANQLSSWDAEIYRRYREWMQDDGAQVSPLDWAQATIRYRRMQDLWAVLQRTFTPTDFETLLRWAHATAPEIGLEVEEIGLPPRISKTF